MELIDGIIQVLNDLATWTNTVVGIILTAGAGWIFKSRAKKKIEAIETQHKAELNDLEIEAKKREAQKAIIEQVLSENDRLKGIIDHYEQKYEETTTKLLNITQKLLDGAEEKYRSVKEMNELKAEFSRIKKTCKSSCFIDFENANRKS